MFLPLIYWTRTSTIQAQTAPAGLCDLLDFAISCPRQIQLVFMNFRMSFYTLKWKIFSTWADISNTFQATFSAHWGGTFVPTEHISAVTHSKTLR